MEIFWAIGLVLLALACPLGMAGMGVGAWVIARARGQKKKLSVGCMPGHGEQQQPTDQAAETDLKEELVRLQGEVGMLKAQLAANGTAANNGLTAITRDEPAPEAIARRGTEEHT
jgi:hypothetical protein